MASRREVPRPRRFACCLKHRALTDVEMASLQCTLVTDEHGVQEKPVVLFFHDESTFHCKDFYQHQIWCKEGSAVCGCRSKSEGDSVMVSAFICLALVLPLYEKECGGVNGWWTSVDMARHVEVLLRKIEHSCAGAECIFVFDHSTNHKKYAHDALKASKMNLGCGVSSVTDKEGVVWHHNFRKGCFNGEEFDMMCPYPGWSATQPDPLHPPEFICKGVHAILTERYGEEVLFDSLPDTGARGPALSADARRELLDDEPDFAATRPLLWEQIELHASADGRYSVWFLPKFHCELNPIELLWCTAKRSLRSKLNGSIDSLRLWLDNILNGVQYLWVAKWHRHCLNFVRGYAKFPLAEDVDNVLPFVQCHSHRKAPQKNSLIEIVRLEEADVEIAGAHFFDLLDDAVIAKGVIKHEKSEQTKLTKAWLRGLPSVCAAADSGSDTD